MRISDWSSDVCSSDLTFPWQRHRGCDRYHSKCKPFDQCISIDLLGQFCPKHCADQTRQTKSNGARPFNDASPALYHKTNNSVDGDCCGCRYNGKKLGKASLREQVCQYG